MSGGVCVPGKQYGCGVCVVCGLSWFQVCATSAAGEGWSGRVVRICLVVPCARQLCWVGLFPCAGPIPVLDSSPMRPHAPPYYSVTEVMLTGLLLVEVIYGRIECVAEKRTRGAVLTGYTKPCRFPFDCVLRLHLHAPAGRLNSTPMVGKKKKAFILHHPSHIRQRGPRSTDQHTVRPLTSTCEPLLFIFFVFKFVEKHS